ncbi:bifunctional phosphopantothenoylcysteine decarboxylase/phosphopantothenate--cysteine ligase CoaBC [bacterium]|nr:bifunctional phosphopantothenoylcysteine decarboxylase/phosphopantothenate--cysteine ligase CoaBC [bacterium]
MRNVLIGITGAIAAYKTCELIRLFKRAGDNVKVLITENTLQFLGKKTLETLSGDVVYLDQFREKGTTEHISLVDWADVFVIAPASANTISKIANGIADNLMTSVSCAYIGHKKPFVLAPSMNTGMWKNDFVQENLRKLENAGVHIIEPDYGFLACGTEGKGKMPAPSKIHNETLEFLNKNSPLAGKRIVITAGGTKEYIDPVRYISNASSGKMGLALAESAHKLGADVVLVSTFSHSAPYKVLEVASAVDMLDATKSEFENSDCLIMAAAVADYRVSNPQAQKITKESNETLKLELVKNPDILKSVAQDKKPDQKIIGFCLATQNLIECAKAKLEAKKCDYIIANEAQKSLGKDDTEIYIISKSEDIKHFENISKKQAADKILELLYD